MSYPFINTESNKPYVKNNESFEEDELNNDAELLARLNTNKETYDVKTSIVVADFETEIFTLLRAEQTQSPEMDLPALLPDNLNQPQTAEQWFEHLNKSLSVVMCSGKSLILRLAKSSSTGRIEVVFGKKNEYVDFFANKQVENGKKFINAFTYWFNHANRTTYSDIDFAPGKTLSNTVYNLWQGFACNPSPLGSWRLLDEHIFYVICNGDPILYEYVLDWLADAIQLPAGKPGVSLVLIGKKGTGKGIFVNAIGKLFGRHFLHLTNSRQLTGQFNSHMQDVILIFADEAFWGGDKQAEGNLKSLITEPFIVIEPKFVNAFTVKSYHRLIIATNNEWVVPASEDERRYCVLNVSDDRIGNSEYFNAMQRQLDNGGYEALLHDLQHRDLSQSNLRDAPRTEGLSVQTYLSDPMFQFLVHCINEQSLFSLNDIPQPWGEGLVLSRTFLVNFDSFCKRLGKTHGVTENSFGKSLRRWLCENDTQLNDSDCVRYRKTRKNIENAMSKPDQQSCYSFKNIDACKAMIERKLGTAWEWNTSEVLDED